MVIEINLAPGAQAMRARRGLDLRLPSLPALAVEPQKLALGGLLAVVLLLAAFGVLRVGQKEEALRTAVATEVRDSTSLAAAIAVMDQLRARQDTITQRIGVIQSVDQRRYVWPYLLDEISTSTPAFTWLTQISTSEAGDSVPGPAFTLQGNAGSTPALTRLMKNLEASPFIRDVTLVTSEQDELEGRTIHRFTLEARYETPDAALLVTVPLFGSEGP